MNVMTFINLITFMTFMTFTLRGPTPQGGHIACEGPTPHVGLTSHRGPMRSRSLFWGILHLSYS